MAYSQDRPMASDVSIPSSRGFVNDFRGGQLALPGMFGGILLCGCTTRNDRTRASAIGFISDPILSLSVEMKYQLVRSKCSGGVLPHNMPPSCTSSTIRTKDLYTK